MKGWLKGPVDQSAILFHCIPPSAFHFSSTISAVFMDGSLDFVFPSTKTALFMDGSRFLIFSSTISAVFMDGKSK